MTLRPRMQILGQLWAAVSGKGRHRFFKKSVIWGSRLRFCFVQMGPFVDIGLVGLSPCLSVLHGFAFSSLG